MGARNSVAIRLATEGKGTVIRDFDEIGTAGESRIGRLRAKYEADVAAMSRASEAAAATARRIAAESPQTPIQRTINQNAGSNVGLRGADRVGTAGAAGDARASATAFLEADRAAADYHRRAVALLSAIDPLYAAQDRFNREMAEAKTLLQAGAISTSQYAMAERQAKAALDQSSAAHQRNAQMSGLASAGHLRNAQTSGLARAGYQQLSFQVGDVTQQLALGVNPAVVFGQQMGQVAQAMMMIQSGAAGPARALDEMKGTVEGVAGSAETASSASEKLASVLGVESTAAEGNSAAAGANAGAKRGQAAATGTASTATGANTAATGTNTAATDVNTAATGRLAAAKAGLVRFLAGPWGAVMIGAVTVLGLLAAGHNRVTQTVESELEKLRENARQAEITRQAHEEFAGTAQAAAAAIRQETAALEAQNRTLAQNQELVFARANQRSVRAQEALDDTRTQLAAAERTLSQLLQEQARADERARSGGYNDIQYVRGLILRLNAARAKVAELRGDLITRMATVSDARRGEFEAQVPIAIRQAQALSEPLEALRQRYDELRRAAITAARGNQELAASLTQTITAINRREAADRAAMERAERDARNATRRAETDAQRAARAQVGSLARPVPGSVLSPFGVWRARSSLGPHPHAGVDINAAVGTPVRAPEGGMAQRRDNPRGLGWYVEIRLDNGLRAVLAHLSGYNIPAGAPVRVERGQVVGYTGGGPGVPGRGNADGTPHLHYELRRGPGRGVPINPLSGAGGGRGNDESLQRSREAMEASTAGALALARAYLESGEAALRAAAMREGATDAARQGQAADEQMRRQLNLDVAEGAARGAQAVQQLETENAARSALTRSLLDGKVAVESTQHALQDEAALRPLLQLQAVAQGEALTVLTEVINRYRAALVAAHAAEANLDAAGAIATLRAANDNARALIGLQGSDRERALSEARIVAEREARAKGYAGETADAFVAERIATARIDLERRAADEIRQTNQEYDNRHALMSFELRLGFMGATQREAALRMEELRLDLQRQFGPEHEAEIRLILAKAAAEDELRLRVEQVRDAHRELEQVGGNIIDEVFDPDNWDDWGETGLRIIRMILQEMLTLAAVNPLKNMLLGQNNPTLFGGGGLGGLLGALFSGGSSFISGGMITAPAGGGTGAPWWIGPVGGNAVGTHYASGGLSWIAENGPEMVSLPRGAKVSTAAETRRLLAANDTGRPIVINTFDMNGAVVTSDLLRQMDARAARAAQEGARMGVDTIMQAHRDSHGRLFAVR